ncbi:hypothetical protein [Roseivirga sp.]|uniref:hypothetical protein n=1 Tax=Roseivirga sp. TaxID=1964215 RepID=UPI002B26B631|nr:hypothetical protein [Roseivirga sp.]
MPSLLDLLGNNDKEKLIEQRIIRGSVIKISNLFKQGGSVKYLVILGKNPSGDFIGSVCINTPRNNGLMQNDSVFKDLQHYIFKSKNGFLKHDSLVNCSQITRLSCDRIKECFNDNFDNHLGFLDEADVKEVIKKVVSAPTITPKQLKEFQLLGA